jgi:hypothetical protein
MTTTLNPSKTAANTGFGIEIECTIPVQRSSEFPRGNYHNGQAVRVAHLSDWNVQSDCSVSATGNFFPAEVVSPILRGEAGLVKVVEMLDYLNNIGAVVNSSCGLHVHVDCSGLDRNQMDRLVKLFKAYEPAFYDMNGEHAEARYSNHYCAPSHRWDGTRYQSLNLQHAHDTNPHIEIRVWQGAMKPETVVAAIYMAVSLVSRATAPELVKTSDLNRSNSKSMMAKFIQRFSQGACNIVADYDPHDIWREMMQAVAVSNRTR